MKRSPRLLLVLLSWMTFAEPHVARGQDQITLGAIADLTGPSAPNGEQCRRGVALAWSQFEKRDPEEEKQVRLVFGDSRGDAKQGLIEFNRLIGIEKAIAVVSTRSQITMPMNPVSKRAGIALLSTIGHDDFITGNPYSFRFWPKAASTGPFTAEHLAARGFKRVAILTLEDEYPLALDRAFQHAWREKGEIVFAETVTEQEPDFAAIASRIRQKKPDIIFVNLGVNQIGLAVRRIREQGIQSQLISNNWTVYPSVIRDAGKEALEGTFFVDFDFLKPEFVRLTKAANNGEGPAAVGYSCYAAFSSVLNVLHRNHSLRSAAEVYAALKSAASFELDDGPLLMKDREAQLDLTFMQIRNGNPVAAVSNAEQAR